MSRTWLISDPHFGHEGIIKFLDNYGNRIRPFDSIDHHDETIINNHNALVNPEDRVYVMGDVAMARRHIQKVARLNGRKKLIKGNHDIYKLQDYTPYFEDVLAYRIYPGEGLIVSHIPVHECQLEKRFVANIHGHTHINLVPQHGSKVPDERYINVCLEHTGFKPVLLDDIIKRVGRLGTLRNKS
jgi:calcineurin-like phosphoesterase family protein